VIDFELDDALSLIRETAREFAQAQLQPRAREFEAARSVAGDVQKRFRQIGLEAMELPERIGGAGLGALARALVLEELGAADAGAALALDPLGPALYPLLELAADDVLEPLVRPLLGRTGARAVLAWDGAEQVRIDDRHVSGQIAWVPADRIDLLVLLRPDGAWAIEEGIAREELRGAGLRAAGASCLRLDSAPVSYAWPDPAGARRALARARLYTAALTLGVMRASAEFSREYALNRVAFGRPIAHHQALAFLIADMAAAVDATRLLVWEAAWRLERGEDASEACATAFAETIEQAMFVTPNGIQILGGHGFMQDYPAEKYMREARTLGLMLGGIDAAREEAGRELARSERPLALVSAEA